MLRLVLFLPIVFLVCSAARWTGQHLSTLAEARVSAVGAAVSEALGAEWAGIEVDGLTLTVSGEAPETETRLLVAALSRAVPQGRVVDATGSLPPAAARRQPMRVDLFRGPGGVTITGRFPDTATRADLLLAIGRTLPGTPIHDLSGLGAGGDAVDGAEIAAAAAALAALPRVAIRIEQGHVDVSAAVASRAEREAVAGSLRKAAGPGIHLALALRVPRRLIAPFRFVVEKSGPERYRLVHCAVRDEVEAETLAAALALIGLRAQQAQCEIGLGGPELDWAAAAVTGLSALIELPEGRFELTGGHARLSAGDAEREVFEQAMTTLATRLPAGFRLEGQIAETPFPVVAAGRLWLRIEREGDVLSLAGRVTGPAARAALADLAAARLGTDLVDHARLDSASRDAVAAGSDDPARFQQAALAAVEAMTGAAVGGRVTVTAEAVEATITVERGSDGAAILRRMAAALPAAHRFQSSVAVDVPGAMGRLPLGQARCAAALNEAVARAPITFDPGSTRLDAISERRVDALARLLSRCDGARIEVGGHTDDQGRAVMNERLSRARAEAVVAALEARGIGPRTAILTARGYGEAEPVASNDTDTGRALNRRIAFRVATPPNGGAKEPAERAELR